jgi:hypothetical protein
VALNDKKEPEFDPALDEEVPETTAMAVKPSSDGGTMEERLVAAMELMAQSNAMLAKKQDQGPIQQVPLPKAELRTPWYKGPRQGRPKLARNTFMNGNMLREILMSNEEVELFNRVKAGRYCNGQVTITEKFSSEGRDEVEIVVANKTRSDQIALAQLAPTAVVLLNNILREFDALA